MRMLIVYKTDGKARKLAEELMQHLVEIEDVETECMPVDELTGQSSLKADLVYILGGDGTILRVVHSLDNPLALILGVNFGRTGFLASIDPPNLLASINQVIKGDFRVEERLMIDILVNRNRQVLFSGVALNEVVVKSQAPKTISVDLLKNGREVYNFEGDGIICATPTGSTGYSFSAGGPIIEPQVQALCITPICSFLSVSRPQIVCINSRLVFYYKSIYDARVFVDGEEKTALVKGDQICVRKSTRTANFVQMQAISSAEKMVQKANSRSHGPSTGIQTGKPSAPGGLWS